MHCPDAGAVGSWVLKVTVPNTVMAEVTTCSVDANAKYQPLGLVANSAWVGAVLVVIANSEFVQITLAPQVLFSAVNQVASVGLSFA